MSSADDEAAIRRLLDTWVAAVRAHDLEAVVADRTEDIVMFDVPEPLQARGMAAYRDTWKLYFKAAGSELFELRELEIAVGGDVAFAHAVLRCTPDPEPAGRLTVGLRRLDGAWKVTHEHHSFPVKLED
jgi:ketosteroid isomerase-like protein